MGLFFPAEFKEKCRASIISLRALRCNNLENKQKEKRSILHYEMHYLNKQTKKNYQACCTPSPPADRCCITCDPKFILGLKKEKMEKGEIGFTKYTQYLPRDGCGVVRCDQCVAFTCCVTRRSCHVGVDSVDITGVVKLWFIQAGATDMPEKHFIFKLLIYRTTQCSHQKNTKPALAMATLQSGAPM